MRDTLLELLACPGCGAALRVGAAERRDGEIAAGELRCAACEDTYPIRGGIPRLLPRSWRGRGPTDPERRTRSHFSSEFLALADGDRDLVERHVQEFYFYSRTGLDPGVYEKFPGIVYPTTLPSGEDRYRADATALRGRCVLDAGCGPGRFVPIAAEAAERVVGLDLGEHIERARARCARLPNVDFVQGSVLEPPFRAGAFDYIYSIGVLHHTPDPRGAVGRLARLLRDGGDMSVWLYPRTYWGGPVRALAGRLVHRAISRMSPEAALRVCSRYLYALGRLQAAVARRRWTKLLLAPLFLVSVPRHEAREVMIATIYDYYGPPIISTHTYGELERWMREAGFAQIHRLPVPIACYGRRRTTTGARPLARG